MKIVIIGDGKVGHKLTTRLSEGEDAVSPEPAGYFLHYGERR